MKKIKTFEQFNNVEPLNEGLMDIINKYSGKLKELFKSAIAKISPENIKKMAAEVAPFKGMSLDQIKQELKARSASNEDLANKVMNITGLSIFSTLVGSVATLIADDKWNFLHKIFNIHDQYGMQGDTTPFLAAAGISFFALVLWLYLKMDIGEESYADATRPSGTTPAERHSSAYIASQMKRNNR